MHKMCKEHPSVFIFTGNTGNVEKMSHRRPQRPDTSLKNTGVIEQHAEEDKIGPCSLFRGGQSRLFLREFCPCTEVAQKAGKSGNETAG